MILYEVETYLKKEGIPDVCMSLFKNGESNEECDKWSETNRAIFEMTDARLKKYVRQWTSDL